MLSFNSSAPALLLQRTEQEAVLFFLKQLLSRRPTFSVSAAAASLSHTSSCSGGQASGESLPSPFLGMLLPLFGLRLMFSYLT
jgi:hypothetical protein